MKIPPSSTDSISARKTSTPGSERAHNANGKAAAEKSAGVRDSVQLSQLSAQLHALESSMAAGGEFDQTKVDAIKEAIRNGTLSINTDVVADRMLAGLEDMLGKTGS